MRLHILPSAITTLCLAISANSYAGGLWLNEYGDFSGGRASAGAAAGVDDASAVIHNAASITRLERDQIMVTVGALVPDIKFDLKNSSAEAGTGNGGSAGVGAPVAALYYVRDLPWENWTGGVYFAGLSGAGLDYNSDWAGRYDVQEISLLMVTLAPTIAYQVTDKLSLGASLQIFYAELELDVAIPAPPIIPPPLREDGKAEVEGDDTDIAFTLGALYEFSPQTRLGIHYQSEVEPEFSGGIDISPAGFSVKSDLTLPFAQMVRVGLHHEVNEKWAVDFTLGWDDWSTLDSLLIATDLGEGALAINWEDTYHYAVGVQYKLDQEWTLTAGVSYDTNPVSAHDRGADLPIDRQVRYAFGAKREVSDTFTVGGYFNYADFGSARISNDVYSGDYSNNGIYQVAINFNWKLGN